MNLSDDTRSNERVEKFDDTFKIALKNQERRRRDASAVFVSVSANPKFKRYRWDLTNRTNVQAKITTTLI